MKVRYLGTLLLAVLTFFGCDDNTGTLGLGMFPILTACQRILQLLM